MSLLKKRILSAVTEERFSSCPHLSILMYRLLGEKKNLLIGMRTEMVIEGFPRSANTFAVVAFRQAQEKPVSIAHHLHFPAQVMEGVRRKLPVLVLIRHPYEAIKSLKIRHPHLNEDIALKRYVRFYTAVYSNLDKVVIGKFEDVVADYGRVIERVNERFCTNYKPFKNTAEQRDIVLNRIIEINSKNRLDRVTSIGLPMKEREKIKDALHLNVDDALLYEASDLYRRIIYRS